jgi:glycine/D-amino acid oxidase-like deaminating enzyme
MFGSRGGIEDTAASARVQKAWMQRRLAEMFPPLSRVEVEYFWRGWVCLSYDRNPHLGTTDDPSVHYALAYIGSGVALATYCGKLLAGRLGGANADEVGPLLGVPLPRIPFPAFRRLYQRAAYAWYGLQDEWL